MRWTSNFAEHFYDQQGDPRWFIDAVGPEVASFFGFKKISATEYWLPDAAEFKGALNATNAVLVRNHQHPLNFDFFLAQSNADVKVSNYVAQVGNHLRLPLAPSGHHLIHDLAFHTGIIFAPKAVADLVQGEAHLHASFFEFIRNKHAAHPEVLKGIAALEYVSNFTDTVRIDVLTGSLAQAIALIRADRLSGMSPMISQYMIQYNQYPQEYLSQDMLKAAGLEHRFGPDQRGLSIPERFLAFLVFVQNLEYYHRRATLLPRMNEDKFHEATNHSREVYPSVQLDKDFTEFLRSYRSIVGLNLTVPARQLTPGLNYKSENPSKALTDWYLAFCEEIRQNKLKLIHAVREMMGGINP